MCQTSECWKALRIGSVIQLPSWSSISGMVSHCQRYQIPSNVCPNLSVPDICSCPVVRKTTWKVILSFLGSWILHIEREAHACSCIRTCLQLHQTFRNLLVSNSIGSKGSFTRLLILTAQQPMYVEQAGHYWNK